jgi:hypothetical protein
MTCQDVFDAFKLATESLDEEIYLRASYRGIWINLIQRGEYKKGTGLEQTTFTLGRSEPTSDEEAWPLISLGSGQQACAVTWNDVNYGFEESQYHPEQLGLRGPIICKDDLIFHHRAERFLEGYLRALTKRSMRSLENRLSNIFCHFSPKVPATSSYTTIDGSTGDPPQVPDLSGVSEPTSELTQEMLEQTAAELNEAGSSDINTDGWINLGEDGPIYPLYIGQEMSHQILFNNADRRQDYRDADTGAGMGAMLLKRVGASKVIGNFRHVINLFPPRYHYVGGVGLTRIPTWVMVAGTKGYVARINPQWQVADFERADVLTPWVFHSEIIRPVNAAAGLSWNPTTYTGEWQFVTGPDIDTNGDCYDPLKKRGRHFAEYKHAPRPIFPEFGRSIFFKRCRPRTYTEVTCTS